jgi:hypothetical protein
MPNDNLTEQYQYKGDGVLISDISASEPLKRKKTKKVEENKEEIKVETPLVEEYINIEPTQKDIYVSMIQENIPFTLKINGTLIFDSENNNIMLLSFEDTYFLYNGNSFPYEGLNFKFKK